MNMQLGVGHERFREDLNAVASDHRSAKLHSVLSTEDGLR